MLGQVFALQDGDPTRPFFTEAHLLEAARALPGAPSGLQAALSSCMEARDVDRRIAEHMAFGQAQGIEATPHTFVIDVAGGREVQGYAGVKPAGFVRELVDAALARGEVAGGPR